MTSRELVKAAIEHRETDRRVPYNISLTVEAREKLSACHGIKDVAAWLDNDVQVIDVPWWWWHNLGDDWKGMYAPETCPSVIGTGSYESLEDNIKAAPQC